MNRLRAATVSVVDCEATAHTYARWLGYRTVERGRIGAALARSWGAPEAAGRNFVVMQPASGAPVFLRFVEAPRVPAYRALRSFGWAALELCVQDVQAVARSLLDSPFEIIGPPADVPGLPSIHPMQVQGPDGEVLYLTEILRGGPGSGLPSARSPVDTLFIAVLACADMAGSAAWFSARFDVAVAPPVSIPYRMLARAFGLPREQLHTLTTASDAGGKICLEFDQYPAAATTRPRHGGHLPPGMAICTLTHPDPGAIDGPWLSPPARYPGRVYDGRLSGTLLTPEGALVEVVESGFDIAPGARP
jgi:hypothetical protein